MSISYNDIINQFESDEWDFSYLTGLEMREVLNQPIKQANAIGTFELKPLQYNNNTIFLIVAKHGYDYDYTINKLFPIKIKKLNLKYEFFDACNQKYAAVKAGLGQYAKNSLLHHPRFDFDFHLGIYILHDEIINLPERNKADFTLLKQCEGCNDCINACPVHAINIGKNDRIWVDLELCDNFCHFGNNGRIPSIKWNLIKHHNIPISNKDIYQITNFQEWINKTGQYSLNINGNQECVIYPICRECTSQKRCTKYGGKYPYDWNRVLVLKEENVNA